MDNDQDETNAFVDETLEQDINTMAKLWSKRKGFTHYYKTSSLFGTNVKNIFDEAIQQTYIHRMEKLKHLMQTTGKDGQANKKTLEEDKKKRKCVIF